jgi:hypothetical protein
MLSNPCQHLRPDILAIVEGEDIACPPFALENLVRAFLTGNSPTDTFKRRENDVGATRLPLPHDVSRCERYAANGSSVDFAGLELVRKNPEGKGTHETRGTLGGLAINQDAGKLGNLRYPAAVRFLLKLDG